MRKQRHDGIVFSHPQLNEYEYRQLYLSVDESANIFQKKKIRNYFRLFRKALRPNDLSIWRTVLRE